MVTDFYEIETAASEQPVTLVEAKAWCKITNSTEDTLITALIVAATEKAEKFTNRVFITRTITGHISGLDCSQYERGLFIALRRAPLVSVTTVKVLVDDTLETVSSDDYNVKETGGFPRIVFEEVNENPDSLPPYPYQVEFVAGYGAAAAVPEAIKTAIMEAVCYWHSNRGDCGGGEELPGIAKGILREYKIINTFA